MSEQVNRGCGAGRLLFALVASTLGLVCPDAAAELPQPRPGWRMELVVEAPRLRHPSVVTCAPDGRVFVAEDPMDISLPRADAAEGRILCLHPDGSLTVFAEKLFAVFGLQYLEGKLYVLHNPRFSVFDDDHGVGRNRRELIAQTLPQPSALNWNDHVPANFRLALDGCFYVASGDKGLHSAVGTDGSRADLFSGGAFRLRPDGTELEVFCHGVRNILDPALNAEDEIFTYDNTDEHDWMGRLTHMVEAGFYGYPHDFIPRRPYTLWMMADYGAGAACGALAYTEDALPPAYHGNLFLADFGKRQIMRVRLERAGGTFRAASMEELFPEPPGDFRPVGLTLAPDSRSFYICDWHHRDEKAAVAVGRLFRLTWTGADHSAPKPLWYQDAAMGRPCEATTGELGRALSHPSRSVRLTAQRRLADRSAAARKEVITLLADPTVPAQARVHALWALDGIDGGRSARAEIIAAAGDADAVMRRQALRQLGHRRVVEAVPVLRERLRDGEASVRFHAATALGRIGEARAVGPLQAALEEPDDFARFAVFTALRRIGTNTPAAWPEIVHGLGHDRARVRDGTVFALRETYDEHLLGALIQFFHDVAGTEVSRAAALELIAAMHRRPPAWDGQWWAYHPALRPPPEKSEAWAGTPRVLATLRDGLREHVPGLRRACITALAAARDTNSVVALRALFGSESDADSRATILRALGGMKDPAAVALATNELAQPTSPPVTAAAIATAGALGGAPALLSLSGFVQSPSATVTGLVLAVDALARAGATSAVAVIRPLARHRAGEVRAAGLIALARLEGEPCLSVLERALDDSEGAVARAAVQALGDLRSTNATPALLKACGREAGRAGAIEALTRQPDVRALDVYLDELASRNPARRNAAHRALRAVSGKVLAKLETRAATLPPSVLVELRQIYAGWPEAERGPLFAARFEQRTSEQYLEFVTANAGDAAQGRKLFFEAGGVNCAACHRVADQGGDTGPDLSGIGAQFDRRALAESILYPGKAVREGYQQVIVETIDGEEIAGVVKGETNEELIVRDGAAHEHRIPRRAIKSRRLSELSLMPEGLEKGLTLPEFADLIVYLASLRDKPAVLPRARE